MGNPTKINSLSPGRCEGKFVSVFFKLILRIDILGISCKIALSVLPQNTTDKKSILHQVMDWCHQATSH